MKKLLCLISCLNAGGAETFLMKVYRKIDKTKCQFDFCVNKEMPGFYDEEVKKNGGKIWYLPPKSNDVKRFRKELYELIEREKYEYVLRIASNGMGFMDLAIAKKAGAKRCILRSSNSSDGASLKSRVAHRLGRFLYEHSIDVKIAPSDLAAKYTFGEKQFQKGNVHILHNGVDLDIYRYDESDRTSIHAEFRIENKFVVGHVGRFNQQKNHRFLVEIFDEIQKLRDDAVLLLVGEGELEEEIKAQIKSLGVEHKVIFTGVRSDIPALLSAMDVFVFPSFYEGMPNTVIEAQATGLPCVISDTITKEADITGLVEYLSLSASAEAWAKKALASVRSERENTRQKFIDNEYDIQSVVDKFVELCFEENSK